MNLVKLLLIGLTMTALTACSKTVQWEEEVLLNTGETIWVKRTGTYSFSYSAGYGEIGYSPDRKSTIEFAFKGKKYKHTDDASRVLLAIAPDGSPNIVALRYEWGNRHGYPCNSNPGYVQFVPPANDGPWTWPPAIDRWTYGLPTNLIFGVVAVEQNGMRFNAADRQRENASAQVKGKEYREIDPSFIDQHCVRSN